MRSPSWIKQNLDDLSARVDSLNAIAAGRLRDLGEAVEGGPSAGAWAFADIYRAINPERLAEQFSRQNHGDGVLRFLELLRNMLVLLPLTITWIGIWLAVTAYHELLKTDPTQAAASFIYLWQDGFQGRTPLSLGTLALIDGSLLAGVFVLTFVVHLHSAWLSSRQQKEVNEFCDELEQALAEAISALSQQRLPQPYASIHQLEIMAQQLFDAIKDERKQSEVMLDRREKEIERLSALLTQLGQQFQNDVLDASRLLRQSQAELLQVVKALGAQIEALSDVQHELLPAVRAAGLKFDGIVVSQEQAAAQWKQVVVEQQALSKSTVQGIDQIAQAAKQLAQVASSVSSVSHTLATEQAKLITTLEKEGQIQSKLAGQVSAAALELGDALKAVKDSSLISMPLRSISSLFEELPSAVKTMQIDLGLIFKEQANAAADIARASSTLQLSATTIDQTLRSLIPVLQMIATTQQP